MNLTKEEYNAINTLHRLSKKWPKTLWLFSASGSLYVMKKDKEGRHAETSIGGMDPDYSVAIVDIENDGGDW